MSYLASDLNVDNHGCLETVSEETAAWFALAERQSAAQMQEVVMTKRSRSTIRSNISYQPTKAPRLLQIWMLSLMIVCRKRAEAEGESSFDYYIFAQQWPAAIYGRDYLYKKGVHYPAVEFTIHGLWPDRVSPNNYPQECPDLRDNEVLPAALEQRLLQHWIAKYPRDPGWLWRHEWEKHGTCTGMSKVQYYEATLNQHEKYNILAMFDKKGIEPNNLFPYNKIDMENAVQEVTGHKPYLKCLGRYIHEVWICLDQGKMMPMSCPPPYHKATCARLVYLSEYKPPSALNGGRTPSGSSYPSDASSASETSDDSLNGFSNAAPGFSPDPRHDLPPRLLPPLNVHFLPRGFYVHSNGLRFPDGQFVYGTFHHETGHFVPGKFYRNGRFVPGYVFPDHHFIPGQFDFDGKFVPGQILADGTFVPGYVHPHEYFAPGYFSADRNFEEGELDSATGRFVHRKFQWAQFRTDTSLHEIDDLDPADEERLESYLYSVDSELGLELVMDDLDLQYVFGNTTADLEQQLCKF